MCGVNLRRHSGTGSIHHTSLLVDLPVGQPLGDVGPTILHLQESQDTALGGVGPFFLKLLSLELCTVAEH